ncbi:unnamed protein product, partial [Ectocarpus sp. 6 AP-2014]
MVGSAAPPGAPSNAPSLLDDFPELVITREDDELLTSLLQESGWGETSNEDDRAINLPIEWVVDIADKDNDWFLATAFGYNDMKQTLHVMVPDGINPTWTGDVAVNQLAVRLLECCDKRSMALFKQLVRESAIEVDWDVSIHHRVTGGEDNDTDDSAAASNRSRKPSSGATAEVAAASATARATLLLPLGNLVVVEVEGGDNSGPEGGASCSISGGSDVVGVVALDGEGGGDTGATATSTEKEQKLVQLDDRFELLHCRGEG